MRLHLPTATGEADELGYSSATWDTPAFLARGQICSEERMPTAILEAGGAPLLLPRGEPLHLDDLIVTDPLLGRDITLATLLDRRLANDGLLVFHDGAVRYEQYRNGFIESDRHVVHSVSKTLTAMMIGIAVDEGRIDPADEVSRYVAGLDTAAWAGVTVQHVLDMATGLATEEHYEDPDSMYWQYAQAVGYYGTDPGQVGALQFVRDRLVERACPPGDLFNYASYVSNLLPACLESAYGVPAAELYEARLYRRLGAESDGALNYDAHHHPVVEGQLNLTLRDFARWALLMLHDGRNLAGEQVVPAAWVAETHTSSPARRRAFVRSDYVELFPSGEYHNQMWLMDPDKGESAMLGIHGQFALLDRRRQLMVMGFSSYPDQTHPLMAASMLTMWDRVQRAVDQA